MVFLAWLEYENRYDYRSNFVAGEFFQKPFARLLHRKHAGVMSQANFRSLSRRGTHEVRDFFSICPLNSLVQLRALTLTYMASSDDPTFQFWTQLSSLKHLRSLIVNFSSYHAVGESLEDQEFLIRSVFNHGFCLALELFKIHISTYVIPRTMTPQLMPTTY